jgi:hypothetical protein
MTTDSKHYTEEELLSIAEAKIEKIPFAKRRYAICLDCEEISKIRTCNKCGCFMPLKVRLSGAECPIGKWNKE